MKLLWLIIFLIVYACNLNQGSEIGNPLELKDTLDTLIKVVK